MKRTSRIVLATTLLTATLASVGSAQTPVPVVPETPAPAPRQTALRQIPLKVQITLVRYQNEKKVSSVPFTLSVTANDGLTTEFNNGQNVPMSSNGQITYQSVGTSINASATDLSDGRFRLSLTINDSSIAQTARDPRSPALALAELASAPTVKSLRVRNALVLRDGQTLEFLASTDQITGEVTRIEVTATALK